LNQSQTKDILMVLPPKEEQHLIVAHIEEIEGKHFSTSTKIFKQIQLLQEYRTTLISEVVTGKIDVRDEVIP